MTLRNLIRPKLLLEALTAIAIPLVYFFFIGGFNGSRQNEQNTKPYDPLSVIKRDFVKDIQTGKFDFSGFDTNKQVINYEKSKLKHFLSSQRIVFSTVNNPESPSDKFYFKNVNGYRERDSSGADVLYLSSGNFVDAREKMTKCYIAQDIYGNIPISLKHDSIVSSEWFVKPKMKIRKSDFSPADTRTVAAIIIYNFAGKMIDSTVIRVRNFSDLSGKYEGDFIDRYNTVDEIPVNNMRISSIDLFKDMPKKNSGFKIKVFWFGEVDLWFEKITMDDNIANKLLEGKYKEHIIKEITHEDFIHTAAMVKNNMFTNFNFTSINYVMNIMYDHLQTSVEPIYLN